MKDISEAVALRIKELLKQRGMSQYRLEHKMGISHDTVKNIMKGKTRGVNLKTVFIIAEGLGVTASEFLDSELFLYGNLNIE